MRPGATARVGWSLCLAFLGACLFHAPDALAIVDEIQVYTDDLDARGESGLELHINTTPSGRSTPDYPGDVPPYHGVRITPEFSWGLGHDLDWGFYVPTTTDSDGHFYLGGAKLRVKWLPVRAEEGGGGWYAGINNELSDLNKSFSDSRWNDEVRIIGGYRRPGLQRRAPAAISRAASRRPDESAPAHRSWSEDTSPNQNHCPGPRKIPA